MSSSRKTLTTGEAAAYCDVNFRTVIRWIERGILQAYKLPGRGDHRIPLEALRAFMLEHNMPIPNALEDNQDRVLIVDDEPAMAAAIARVLKRSGKEVDTALDGFSAGSKLQTFRPALITLDLKMPGVNGFDVLHFVKSDANVHPVKVLIISAEPAKDLHRAHNYGADAILAKPFDNEELVATVNHLLSSD